MNAITMINRSCGRYDTRILEVNGAQINNYCPCFYFTFCFVFLKQKYVENATNISDKQ